MLHPAVTVFAAIVYRSFAEAFGTYVSLLWSAIKDFLLGHLFIIVLAVILGWFANSGALKGLFNKFPESLREPLRFLALTLLVLPIATCGRFNADSERRLRVAEESRLKVHRAFSLTVSELVATSNHFPASRLIILSEGIGKITSRTFDVVDNIFPSAKLRTLSLFIDLGDSDCDEAVLSGCIEDIVQEGELEKDRRYFSKSTSLVGAAITDSKPYYCPDVSLASASGSACEKFQPPPPGTHLSFASVICYPLTFVGQNTAPDSKPFAAICLDSKKKHAFDDELKDGHDRLWDSISIPAGRLSTLLYEFKELRKNQQVRGALECNQALKKSERTKSENNASPRQTGVD